MIVAIFDTPERRQRVAFTSEVMPTYNLSATLAPHAAPASLDELRRLKVGVAKGTATAEDPAVAAIGSLHRFESKEAMLAALRSGTVEALVMPVSELALASVKLPACSRACRWAPSARAPGPCARRTPPCAPRSTSTSSTCARARPGTGCWSSTSASARRWSSAGGGSAWR